MTIRSAQASRTCKYRPTGRLGFATKADAQAWVKSFASWYNGTHLHSAIRFVTPNARHVAPGSARHSQTAPFSCNCTGAKTGTVVRQNPKLATGWTGWLNPVNENSASEIETPHEIRTTCSNPRPLKTESITLMELYSGQPDILAASVRDYCTGVLSNQIVACDFNSRRAPKLRVELRKS